MRHFCIIKYTVEFPKNAGNHATSSPFPLRHVDFHLTHECLGPPHSPPQTAPGSNQPCCHCSHVRTERWEGRMFYSNSALLIYSDRQRRAKNSPTGDWGHLLTLTLTSDDLESHIVVNVSSTLTNTTIWFVEFIRSSLRRWPKIDYRLVISLNLNMSNSSEVTKVQVELYR